MTDQQKIIAVICGGALFWYAMRGDGRRRDEVPMPPQDAPSFSEVFASNPDSEEAKRHAQRLGDMCWEIANKIEYDAKKNGGSRFKSDDQIQDFRVQVRDYLEEGGSYGELYPKLGPTMQTFFDARVGDRTEDLTDKRRQDWVSAFRGVGAALLNTSEGM